jgi:hypothetical protein
MRACRELTHVAAPVPSPSRERRPSTGSPCPLSHALTAALPPHTFIPHNVTQYAPHVARCAPSASHSLDARSCALPATTHGWRNTPFLWRVLSNFTLQHSTPPTPHLLPCCASSTAASPFTRLLFFVMFPLLTQRNQRANLRRNHVPSIRCATPPPQLLPSPSSLFRLDPLGPASYRAGEHHAALRTQGVTRDLQPQRLAQTMGRSDAFEGSKVLPASHLLRRAPRPSHACA